MSDESRTPDPDGPAQPQAAPREETGIIDLRATQAIHEPGAPEPVQGAAATDPSGASSSDTTSDTASDTPSDTAPDWFEVFGPEHPTEGPGVPARADAAWGSDRAESLAEEAHRAAYAPPAAPATTATGAPTPMSAVPLPEGPAAGSDGPADGPADLPSNLPPAASPVASPVAVSAPPVPRRRRRGLLVALVAAMCLASGLIGGVAGRLIDDSVTLGSSSLPEPGPGSTARPAGSVANIAATALPSVVTIQVSVDGGSDTGSGFVVDNRGHILTNNHVVAAAADSGDISVLLSNGDTVKARIVGRDASYDLAVLKMDRTDLKPLQLGASDQVVVGDQVIAVGAPLGLEQTVTTGIVSALNRPVSPGGGNEASYINAIQTDAAINPGNSGGPLLDMSGRVIGVNSAIARVPGTTGATGGNIGLGFAIPSDQARRTADQLIATGKATHPVIGVKLDRTFSGDGAQVLSDTDAVTSGGPADKAGVKPGDVIIGFEGQRIRTPDQLIVAIRARAVGDKVTLKVERDGREIDLSMTLEADPGK